MITFPFLGIGGLTAIAVLVVAYVVFAAFARLLEVAAAGAMSVVPGIVTGIRDWARDEGGGAEETVAPAVPWEDLPPGAAIEDQVGAE